MGYPDNPDIISRVALNGEGGESQLVEEGRPEVVHRLTYSKGRHMIFYNKMRFYSGEYVASPSVELRKVSNKM